MPAHVPLFLLTVTLIVLMPGASNVTILRQTLAGGRLAGWRTVAGTSSGIVIWSIAAALGLSVLLVADPLLYNVFRVAGGGVMVFLGVRTLFSARPSGSLGSAAPQGDRAHRDVVIGLTSVLANPNAGLFALSLLPQFVTRDGPVLLSTVGLGVVWAAVSGSWNSSLVYATDRVRSLIAQPVFRCRLEAVTGVTLMLAGVYVAVSG